jgi:hypothetical protein
MGIGLKWMGSWAQKLEHVAMEAIDDDKKRW